MGQSPSIPVEHGRLIFSKNNLSNNSIQCDALGIHYQLSTPSGMKNTRVTTVSRWVSGLEKDIPVATWEKKIVGSGRIRLASGPPLIADGSESEDGFVPVDSFFPRTGGLPTSICFRRSFTVNGETYTWKSRQFSLKLFREDEDVPIASYSGRRTIFNPRKPHIKLGQGCDGIMDYILLTCMIAEKKRRDAKRRQHCMSSGA